MPRGEPTAVFASLSALGRRLFAVTYQPEPALRTFLERAQTQESPLAQVIVAVLDAAEGHRRFGVPLARRGVQPVYLRITNRGAAPLRLYLIGIDRNYYTPLEAAAVNHFSMAKRLSGFGLIAWLFLPLLIFIVPFKLISAYRANRRMDDCFRSAAFRLRPIPPGESSEGFVFTPFDEGTKIVRVQLHAAGAESVIHAADAEAREAARQDAAAASPAAGLTSLAAEPTVEFTFSIAVPGLAADYLRRDLDALHARGSVMDCSVPALLALVKHMPAATTNRRGTGHGDPLNLVVIGEFSTLLASFAARWDESETISLATCWKTVKAFVLGSQYRYSPVSPLYLFGRSQDVALQRIRHSINERLHLRLWLTSLQFRDKPVWIGQVSRDIGVRLTWKTWNLTTHRIDPDVDEARDYVLEDLLEAEHVEVAGYIEGVGACDSAAPRRNLTGDTYFTDGKRAAILLSPARAAPRLIEWA